MRTRTKAGGAALLVAALAAVAALPTHDATAATGARPVSARAAGASARVVTLVTGDRVTVLTDARGVATVAGVTRGKGRAGITFVTTQVPGQMRVMPSDVLPLLRAGRLDIRLFDVSRLLEYGYDDRRADLPLILTGDRAATRSRSASLAGARAVKAIPGGTALRVAKADLGSVWQSLRSSLAAGTGLSKLWVDGISQPLLDQSVPQIGAPAAWTAGYTGAGVKVAVVDTGIDATHPDLAGRVIAAQDFTGEGDTLDRVGHGTHVAATIASFGSPYKGVAPGAQLLSAKVCMRFGCPDSAILAGMQWAAEQGAKVINMSLGGGDTPEQDPREAAVEDLTARYGTLFVVSAGNAGADGTIGSPGSADSALTVGAVTKSDELAGLSSRGPRVGDAALKPDITAPGIGIVAARSKDAVDIAEPGETHVALNGTSMAAPHVAGAAAILAQEHPDWTPAALKAALMGSAKPAPGVGPYGQGAGRVDVARAIGQAVRTEPASVSFGRQLWPHQDDARLTRTVTYRNLGGAAVTLALSLTGGAPAGMFTLSADSVTVPAGGTASVTLTADTTVAGPDGFFGGHLVAQGGGQSVSTPFAVDKEVESYDVTLRHIDRAGQPAQNFFTLLFEPHAIRFADVFGAPSSTQRLPKGRYVVLTDITDADGIDHTHLVTSELNLDRPRTLTLDARTGRPISVTVPQPDAAPVGARVDSAVAADGGGTAIFQVESDSFTHLRSAPAGQHTRNPALTTMIAGVWAKGGVDPADSPYVTNVAWREKGRMFAGLRKRVAKGELAAVEADHAAQGSTGGDVFAAANWPDGPPVFFGFGTPVRLPGHRVEYYNAQDGARWRRLFTEFDPDTGAVGNALDAPLAAYKAGKRYQEHRNRAVYGPGFSDPPLSPELWVTRLGDRMILVPTVLNDQLNWAGSTSGTLRVTLDRDGTRVVDVPSYVAVEVPPGEATYKLGAEVTRGAPSLLSTKVSCVWTFRSATVAGEVPRQLPLSAVRFLPPLNAANTAPAGREFAVPFEVQRQPGSSAGPVRTLTVEASYDDGATWSPVRVTRYGQRGVAYLNHPAGAGFVSLRASATDTAGNTVDQTVVRAYRIG